MIPLKQNNKTRTIKIDLIEAKRPEFHFKVNLKGTNLAGIALETAKPGDKVRVARRGFYSDFDGDFFFTCLNEISELILQDWLNKGKIKESKISNCLIFIDKNSKADVFVNCPTFMEVTIKESSKNHSLIKREDISDIQKVSFSGVNLRSDLAVIYIFSNRWRRGIFFDLLPIDPKITISQPTDLSVLFGACYAFLTFPEIYQYQTDTELKNKLYSAGWFPFIQILGKPFNEIFNMIKNDLPLTDIEKLIISSFDETKITSMYNTWVSNQLFKKREVFLKKGIEEYLEKDCISAIHILYPCIEGILQDLSYDIETQGDAGERLTTKLISYLKSKNPETRLLLPDNFKEYLIDSYFMKFNRQSDEIDLSRHSLAHGAAINEDDYNQAKTLQAILILDQLSSYMQA
jgi:hypothetical protein